MVCNVACIYQGTIRFCISFSFEIEGLLWISQLSEEAATTEYWTKSQVLKFYNVVSIKQGIKTFAFIM